jgi:hypothetical protein
MLIPSSLNKDEIDKKKNQVDKLKFILICFISLLSIGRRTIKRDATWWSWQNQSARNPERFHEWCKDQILRVCWNLSYRSDRYCTLVRPVWPIQEQVRSLYRLSEPFAGHVWYWTGLVHQTIWPLKFKLHRTSPAITGYVRLLIQIGQFREFPSESALSPVGVTLLVWPVWWIGLTSRVWQPKRLVFQILYKRPSTPTLGGCCFLTIFIIFWQPLELSPTSLCEI